MKTHLVTFFLYLAILPLFAQIIPSNQNPKFNSSLNPKYNSNINPVFNSQINPKYNSNINPKYTANINPKYTSSTNPKYNSDLNPAFNSKINPKYNFQLNPNYGNWEGYYMFNQSAEIIGFLIYANADVYCIITMMVLGWDFLCVLNPISTCLP